jgi:DNA-binding transcriptional LysR family regulator
MNLDELRAFLAVIDGGSLAAASKSLRFPMATLRRRVDELEVRMGVKLLIRSRQGAVPTTAGSVLAKRARALLSEVQSLAELVRGADSEPSGELVIVAQQGLPPPLVAQFFSPLIALHSKVVWRVHMSEDPVRDLSPDVHAVLCLQANPPEDSRLARPIFKVPQRLVATPDYLERNGLPRAVEDLASHRLLLWRSTGGKADLLPLADGSVLPVVPALTMGDIFLLRQCAIAGGGIAFVPDLGNDVIPEGLVPVLDGVVGRMLTLWVLAHPTTFQSPRLRTAFEQFDQVITSLQS